MSEYKPGLEYVFDPTVILSPLQISTCCVSIEFVKTVKFVCIILSHPFDDVKTSI